MSDQKKTYGGVSEREDGNILSFDSLQKQIGYCFQDIGLLDHALTHRSYINETGKEREESNERLEFLGDAVLELVVSEQLYQAYASESEGRLSKRRASLVCESALSKKAEEIGLGSYLHLGKGEEKTGGRHKPSVTSDALEALIGAVYLDGGIDAAKELIRTHILNDLSERDHDDYKTALQEYVQGVGIREVRYQLLKESGPDHDKSFTMAVIIDGQICESGNGRSKKAAEQMAAKAALARLQGQRE